MSSGYRSPSSAGSSTRAGRPNRRALGWLGSAKARLSDEPRSSFALRREALVVVGELAADSDRKDASGLVAKEANW